MPSRTPEPPGHALLGTRGRLGPTTKPGTSQEPGGWRLGDGESLLRDRTRRESLVPSRSPQTQPDHAGCLGCLRGFLKSTFSGPGPARRGPAPQRSRAWLVRRSLEASASRTCQGSGSAAGLAGQRARPGRAGEGPSEVDVAGASGTDARPSRSPRPGTGPGRRGRSGWALAPAPRLHSPATCRCPSASAGPRQGVGLWPSPASTGGRAFCGRAGQGRVGLGSAGTGAPAVCAPSLANSQRPCSPAYPVQAKWPCTPACTREPPPSPRAPGSPLRPGAPLQPLCAPRAPCATHVFRGAPPSGPDGH